MVKMSLVNMYLHKFTNPKINEYDTLSSEDRWNEYYDVILANPPFFSPKGGIMPHNRFGVKSTKAEVLFVDYINEHLKPNGRAGIIVPEGIIFQTGIAYKQLKKRLIETSLIGVISLPAGVFQPYSGVKTSILILDKEKNKIKNDIFFINIKSDGYDLTSNRKKREENDLPNIIKLIRDDKNSKLNLVKKEDILKNECSLNYSSYKDDKIFKSNYKIVLLREYVELKRGTSITKKDVSNGNIPVIAGGQKPAYFHNKSNRKSNCITISSSGAYAGYVAIHNNPIFASDCFTIETSTNELNQKFLYYLLKSKQELIYSFQTGGGQPHVYAKDFNKFKIPLPSLETQNQIVEELDSYQKIINGCRQVIENYKPSIDIDSSWELVELDKIAEVISGQSPPSSSYNVNKNGLPFYQGKTDYGDIYLKDTDNYTSEVTKISKKNDIIMSVRAPVGPVNLNPFKEICIGRGLCAIRPKNMEDLEFIFNYLQANDVVKGHMGSTYESINRDEILKIKIPNPDRKNKDKIINQILEERKIIEGNKKIIVKFSEKISNTINKIWSN